MKIRYNSKKTYPVCFLASIFIFAMSCTKTVYEHSKRPYHEIKSFIIPGYGEAGTINGVIRGDSIIIYWDKGAEAPSTIVPTIVISDSATVSPASGESVAFSAGTIYTVTAEDGSSKQYRLKPVFNQATPRLSYTAPSNVGWMGTAPRIFGENFLATGDTSDIRVYAQRVRDGYEFDLPIVREQVTETFIQTQWPTFTAEQDSGVHRIWLKVGELPSDAQEIWVGYPKPSVLDGTLELEQAGQDIHIGDALAINYLPTDNAGGAIAQRYNIHTVDYISLAFRRIGSNSSSSSNNFYLPVKEFSVDNNQLLFNLPATYQQYDGGPEESVELFLDNFYLRDITLYFPYRLKMVGEPVVQPKTVTLTTNETYLKRQ